MTPDGSRGEVVFGETAQVSEGGPLQLAFWCAEQGDGIVVNAIPNLTHVTENFFQRCSAHIDTTHSQAILRRLTLAVSRRR